MASLTSRSRSMGPPIPSLSRLPGPRRSERSATGQVGAYAPVPALPFTQSGLQRLQELDEIGLLLGAELQMEMVVVVIDHLAQGGEAAVVVEAALGVGPEPLQGGGAVVIVGGAAGLEVVDPDLLGGVQVPPGLGVERGHVAVGAAGLAENLLAALSGGGIEAAGGRRRRRDGELIEVEGRELRRHPVDVGLHVAEAV